MPAISIISRSLILAIVLLGNHVDIEVRASIPNASAPRIAGYSVDQAAAACLDWAWSINHAREVAGGVLWNDEGNLTCSRLTLGARNSILYDMAPRWLVQFHTHTGPGRISHQDRETVAHLDPLSRPGYVREPSGAILVYECFPAEHERECRERRVGATPIPWTVEH